MNKVLHEIPNYDDKNDFTLVDVLITLAKHKRALIGFPLVAAIIAAGISMILPPVFQATTTMLPPQQAQSSASAILSQLGGMASIAGVGGLKSPNEMYIGMLKSRTVADRLIERFQLTKTYQVNSLEEARKRLQLNTKILAGKDGLITIAVEDENQAVVAPMANGYVEELHRLTQVLAVTEAGQRRIFFEKQLQIAKGKLEDSEVDLKSALARNGMTSVDSSSRAIIETAARIRAEITAKQIQMNSMTAFVTKENSEYKRTEQELNSLKAELSRLEGSGSGSAVAESDKEKQPGLETMKFYREVKYQQTLFELLARQYEVARLDEAKEAPVIQVLDPAVTPERKFKPKRGMIVISSAIGAFFFAVLWAFICEAKRRLGNVSNGSAKLDELRSHLRVRGSR